MIKIPFKSTEKASDWAAAKTIQYIYLKLQMIPPNLRMSSHYNIEILLLWNHVSIPACDGLVQVAVLQFPIYKQMV